MAAPFEGALNPGDMGSDVFRLLVNSGAAPVTAIPNIKFEEYAALAEEYRRIPSYCSIDPSNYMGVHYAWLAADGPVDLTVTCPKPVKKVTVHPTRRRTQATIDKS